MAEHSVLATMWARVQTWEGFLVCALIFIVLMNTALSPQFMTLGNQINLFQLSIEKIIVALVMTFVIINAEIDLSVGSMMGLAACAFGYLFQAGVDPAIAIGLVLLLGATVGR
jgi:rhamnose transport system permease protein